MGKSFFQEDGEQQGSIPALTGALVEITNVERKKTGPNSQTPGCRMYQFDFKVVKPEDFSGMFLTDWIVIGREGDLTGESEDTWKQGREKGPGKLTRLLNRAGVALVEDDEDWMETAVGNQVVTPISARPDKEDASIIRNRPGKYFRESDDDCPVIGLAEARNGKPKSAKSKPAKVAPKPAVTTDDDDE